MSVIASARTSGYGKLPVNICCIFGIEYKSTKDISTGRGKIISPIGRYLKLMASYEYNSSFFQSILYS